MTAPLVYVNFGMPDDYKELARRNIDVKGKIVIVRYGAGWRGLKPKLAQEHGAVGCLIYSDPHEDGYFAGDAYPKGGFRPSQGVQRGSVLDLPVAPGDPLTPGVGATANAKRLKLEQAKTILKIPVMPISYGDAQPLLAALGGPVAPPQWRGALPITYHVGPGPASVHLSIQSDWSRKPAYDVIARIPGAVSPDEWVVRGNHRDGWVFGAGDPLSGHVAMMAEAKAIGALLKEGWRPKRTIVYASWDAEEPGLLGSVEWAEAHAAELQSKAVLYVNSDGNARGFLSAAGSHSLQGLVNEVAKDVKDPQTGVSVKERLDARSMVEGYDKDASNTEKDAAKKARAGEDFRLGALGSGSDFTPFLQHLGVTTLNIGYGGEDDTDGIYHSNYDSFDHYVRFGDPGFAYGVTEAQTVGRLILRVANAGVLPMEFGSFADTIDSYVKDLHELADNKRKKADDLAQLLDKKAFELAADPTRRVAPPQREPEVPFSESRGARQCGRACEEERQGLRRCIRRVRVARYGVAGGTSCAAQLTVARNGRHAHQYARTAGTRMVPALHLRAGPADRLRREDNAGRSRGDRGEPVGTRERVRRADCGRADEVQRAAGSGNGVVAVRAVYFGA